MNVTKTNVADTNVHSMARKSPVNDKKYTINHFDNNETAHIW